MLAKFRCSNHSLLIETGRHCNIELAERKCSLCGKIEDEIHFSVECPRYDTTRNKFFRDFNISCVEMNTTFIRLFTSREPNLLKRLARFINACACIEIRSHVLPK